ncbi:MAG: STAS domain-containing protein [Lachnospiraceae bacterium]|nr:STAS domain-containing protein [Lachnospiraceae bacterium]
MKINKIEEGNKLTVAIEGRLDTTTAPELENEFKASLENVEDLLLDFEKLDYISSAGLRVLLSAQKQMNKVGKMTITNVSPEIMEIFEVTGFSDILTFA